MLSGWINIDKPLGLTSFDVVARVRRLLGVRKVGHAGTLDPLASGVLPVAVGEATKTIPFLVDATKTYQFTVQFGEERNTDDAEGAVVASSSVIPTKEQLLAALPAFTGHISQVPPAYSAIKVAGKRAYARARAGEEVVLAARQVTVHSLILQDYRPALGQVELVAECSKGTYIRSLGRDIARFCGALGYISHLRRLAVGNFLIKDAILLETCEKIGHNDRPAAMLMPMKACLDDIPGLSVTEAQAAALRQGKKVSMAHPLSVGETVCVFVNDELVAIAEIDALLHIQPKRVFGVAG